MNSRGEEDARDRPRGRLRGGVQVLTRRTRSPLRDQAAREGKLRKRDKFDPENAKTTVERQAEVYNESKRGKKAKGSVTDVDEEDVQFQKVEFHVRKVGEAGSKAERGSSTQQQRKKTKQTLLKEALKKKERAAQDSGSNIAWGDAFDRAEGKKVFDDPKKLAKVRITTGVVLLVGGNRLCSDQPQKSSLSLFSRRAPLCCRPSRGTRSKRRKRAKSGRPSRTSRRPRGMRSRRRGEPTSRSGQVSSLVVRSCACSCLF